MKRLVIAILTLATMLSTSVFAKETDDWAKNDYYYASQRGVIPLSMATLNFKDDITRAEFVDIVMNMFDAMTTTKNKLKTTPFLDCDDEKVIKAYSLGIVSGKTDNLFCPNDLITRQEIARILITSLSKAGKDIHIDEKEREKAKSFSDYDMINDWAKAEVEAAVSFGLLSGINDFEIAPFQNATRQQAIAIVSRSIQQFNKNAKSYKVPTVSNIKNGAELSGSINVTWSSPTNVKLYKLIIKDDLGNVIDSTETKSSKGDIDVSKLLYNESYSVSVCAKSDDRISLYSQPVEFTYIKKKEYSSDVSFLNLKQKYQRVFPNGVAFETAEEADQYMKTVKVPVWKLNSDGTKTQSKLELCINAALAEDAVQIFTEIFNDSEQFPIKNVGGYCFRQSAVGRVSEHSYGTCIDINWDENYYCYKESGEAITGSFWLPYENPYSIPEDSSVVKIFNKYGWSWGGNAWSKLADYMHFTYLGN